LELKPIIFDSKIVDDKKLFYNHAAQNYKIISKSIKNKLEVIAAGGDFTREFGSSVTGFGDDGGEFRSFSVLDVHTMI
jgi:hypothetical protein